MPQLIKSLSAEIDYANNSIGFYTDTGEVDVAEWYRDYAERCETELRNLRAIDA